MVSGIRAEDTIDGSGGKPAIGVESGTTRHGTTASRALSPDKRDVWM